MTINADDTAVFKARLSERTHPTFFDDIQVGGHLDKMKRGPFAVAIDVKFHARGARLIGFPSHTLPLSLGEI
jgi:hypothetical protein